MKLKKILAGAMAGAMVLGSLSVVSAEDSTSTSLLIDGLTAYYSFDETLENAVTGGSATLHGGTGDTWNSEVTDTASYETGVSGSAFLFGENTYDDNGYLSVAGYGLQLDSTVSGDSYTISFWVKPSSYDSNYTSLVFATTDGAEVFSIDALNGYLCTTLLGTIWNWDDRGNSFVCLDGDNTGVYGNVGEWTYVTVTSESGAQNLYFNGNLWTSATSTSSNVVELLKDQTIFLGINWWDASFEGLMDEVTIYNTALTADEVATLYANNGNPYETSTSTTVTNDTEKLVADGYWFSVHSTYLTADSTAATWTFTITVDDVDESADVNVISVELQDANGNYITTGSNGESWYAYATGDDIVTTGSAITLEEGATYTVMVVRVGSDFIISYFDENENLLLSYSCANTNLDSETSAYVYAQVGGTYTVDATVIYEATSEGDDGNGDGGDDGSDGGTTDTTGDTGESTGSGEGEESSLISITDVEAGKAAAVAKLAASEDEVVTVSTYEVVSTENVGEGDWTVVLSSDEFVAGTTYAVHIGNSTIAEVLLVECTEDGVLTIENALGTEIAGIYYVEGNNSSSNGGNNTTSASPKDGSDASAATLVLIALFGCAAIVASKKKMA